MDENIKLIKTSTLQEILQNNGNLLSECLDVGNLIYSNLTSDSRVSEAQKEITCMKAAALDQTEKLDNLLNILLDIKSNMFC